MLREFAEWLSRTELSQLFTDTNRFEMWLLIPLSQTIHTLALGFVLIAAGVLNLRMLGVVATGQPYAKLSNQLVPWVWAGLAACLVTGLLQTIAEPSREIMNLYFRLKLIGLVFVVTVTYVFAARVKNDPMYWELSESRHATAKVLAAVALAVWVGIAVAGRWIAYFGGIES
jgi:outer membrane protein W